LDSGLIPDPEYLRLISQGRSPRFRAPRLVRGERFLCGPVPLRWLERAGRCRGKSLHVGIVLWYRLGLTKQRQIPLGNPDLKRFGVSRFAASRALCYLEHAGLVSVVRFRGRKRLVTICPAPDPDARSKSPAGSSDPHSQPEAGSRPGQ